ncbi:MAG: thiolase family protein [Deltaproteobacteria bacterium]|nr:MAG: thiolase family protein [Deltaproteobacteria bacterium]
MRDVAIVGVGMTRFGKFLDRSPQDLGLEAVWNAIEDANVPMNKIQVAYVGNALGPQLNELKGTIGQHILTNAGFQKIPITNVENACSSGSSALRLACLEVASGNYDMALALGVEKMYTGDSAKAAAAMASGTPYAKLGFTFVAEYALNLKKWMKKNAVTVEHFAKVVVKNTSNGSLNPYAQFRKPLTIEEVLNSRLIANPLTLYMCSSMADGAAAALVCPKSLARKYSSKPLVEVAACELTSGSFPYPGKAPESTTSRTAKIAYEKAGIGPEDVNVAEVHDAMAPAELKIYEELGFCQEGQGGRMIDEGRTTLSGVIPVNPSGGLAAKGHPVGATGLAQIAEVVWQLRGEAGERQVSNAKVGLTQNQGGLVRGDNGACTVTILKR